MYLCHFPSSNIFRYSFVDFWMTEYIFGYLFVNSLKSEYFQIFALNLILIFACFCLMNNENLGLIYASNKHLAPGATMPPLV